MKKIKFDKFINYVKKYLFLIIPFLTCLIFLLICNKNSLYPFGNKTIAWCDMNQQVIPLLNCLKDILSGKQGFTYNLANAGGMSLFGVYFFFLSSPLSFLIIFVEKANMANFMNLLVMFKLMIASSTISFYLSKKYKDLNILINISLSLLYAFSIYNLMYYQNIMWLDIVYLFPLLVLSLDYLLEREKFVPYLIFITLTVIINYYLAFMVICFVIFYFGLQLIFKRNEIIDMGKKAKLFIFASFVGMVISCVSIVPSFIQYLESARGSSLIDNLSSSYFITHLYTILPLLFGSICIIPFAFNKKINIDRKVKYILLLLLLIPMVLDPINKMWHLGSYQSFPCRFSFIITFLILDLVGDNFNSSVEEKFNFKMLSSLIISIILIISLYVFSTSFVEKRIDYLNKYTTSLWGDETSFEALLRYYIIILVAVLIIYFFYKFKLSNKKIVSLSLINLTIIEILFSTSVYLIPPSRDSSYYQELYSLKEIIDDDSFYRVKMDYKMTDANLIGGAGFSSLSHYTSLTNKDYLYTMKKLGYSSYWMEVNSNGGTSFTDALLINKYTLKNGASSSSTYSSENYHFNENKVLPFGLITSNDLSKHQILEEDNRVNMQESIYTSLFNDGTSLHTTYTPYKTEDLIIESNDKRTSYITSGDGTLEYKIKLEGKQSLYFEAFDRYSNSLSEKINDKISIQTNKGKYISSYPTQSNNGTVYLGTYEDITVSVKVYIKESIDVSSLNVFSVNEDLLSKQIENAKCASLEVSPNKIEGIYEAEEDCYLFLPISYFKGINAKINNQKVEVEKVFSSFVSIKLKEGINEIKITYSQPGLPLGIILMILGIGLLILYFIFKDKIKLENKLNKFSYFSTISLFILLIIILYIFPIITNVIHQIK